MAKLLEKADHRRIAEAIRVAEAQTDGEIYCVVAGQVATYRWVPFAFAGLAALCVPILAALVAPAAHRWPLLGEGWTSGNLNALDVDQAVAVALLGQALLQALVFAAVFALALPKAVRVALTPRPIRRIEVQRAAVQQFLARGLQRTSRRTGVLIFVAIAERQAVLLADAGINAKVAQSVWDEAVAGLTAAAGAGRLADGFVAAVAQCGAVLAEHFPPLADPVNEIPDRVVEI
jgi:putative membrane protein